MSVVHVVPARAHGDVTAPPSKSYTHRALLVGHLSRRPYDILNPLDSGDTRATARGIGALGTPVHRQRNRWSVRPGSNASSRGPVFIDCGESGTTLRFLAATAALTDREVVLHGRGRLPQRPMEGLLTALRALGATCERGDRGMSIRVRGPIRSGEVRLDASTSSQFASALLLTLPTLDGESILRLIGPIVSAPYLDATLAVLAHHRIRVQRDGHTFRIPGAQRYAGRRFHVPGDASSAAYLWAAAASTGGEVRVRGVGDRWPQADRAILRLLEQIGAVVIRSRDGAVVRGRALRPFRVDLTDSPDLYSLAGALAMAIPGRSWIQGAPHVVLKESDRKRATATLVRSFGARVRPWGDGLVIYGSSPPSGVRLTNLSDHRLVMSAAVGALGASRPSTIGDARAVRKSFPEFWRVLRAITGGRAG